jgi:hypothetical protein
MLKLIGSENAALKGLAFSANVVTTKLLLVSMSLNFFFFVANTEDTKKLERLSVLRFYSPV